VRTVSTEVDSLSFVVCAVVRYQLSTPCRSIRRRK